jgi:hypothetical protein
MTLNGHFHINISFCTCLNFCWFSNMFCNKTQYLYVSGLCKVEKVQSDIFLFSNGHLCAPVTAAFTTASCDNTGQGFFFPKVHCTWCLTSRKVLWIANRKYWKYEVFVWHDFRGCSSFILYDLRLDITGHSLCLSVWLSTLIIDKYLKRWRLLSFGL